MDGGKLTLQADKVRIIAAGQAAHQSPPTRRSNPSCPTRPSAWGSRNTVIVSMVWRVADGLKSESRCRSSAMLPAIRAILDKSQALQTFTAPSSTRKIRLKSHLTQRKGASLVLQAGSQLSTHIDLATTVSARGQRALVEVGPGQKIDQAGVGQITLNGTFNAWGGAIINQAIRAGSIDDATCRAQHPFAGRNGRAGRRVAPPPPSITTARHTAACRTAAS